MAVQAGEFVPNLVSDAWFQSLRPHLPDRLRKQSTLHCDAEMTMDISDEIDRIQRDWRE